MDLGAFNAEESCVPSRAWAVDSKLVLLEFVCGEAAGGPEFVDICLCQTNHPFSSNIKTPSEITTANAGQERVRSGFVACRRAHRGAPTPIPTASRTRRA